MTELAAQIEAHLMTERRWFSSEELCTRFGLPLDGRAFRQIGDQEGLCSNFAVSGNKGFKHVFYATDGEWDRFYNRMRNHGIGELVRTKKLLLKRRSMTTIKPPVVFEKTTGQALLIT